MGGEKSTTLEGKGISKLQMMHDYVYTDTYTLYICVVHTYMYRLSPQFQFVLFEIMLNWYKWKLIVLIFIHRSFDIGFHFASYLSAALWDTLWYCASHCVRVKLPSLPNTTTTIIIIFIYEEEKNVFLKDIFSYCDLLNPGILRSCTKTLLF